MPIPTPDLYFIDAPRPAAPAAIDTSVPEAMIDALKQTHRTKRALKVDVSTWAPNVKRAIYRRILALNRDDTLPLGPSLGVYGRQEADALYFWAAPRDRRRKRKTTTAARKD